MPADAVKIFTYEVPVKNGALDGITADELKAIEAKGVKLFVGEVEVESVTHETNAFIGTSAYIKTNTCYVGAATITKTGTVSTTETEYETKTTEIKNDIIEVEEEKNVEEKKIKQDYSNLDENNHFKQWHKDLLNTDLKNSKTSSCEQLINDSFFSQVFLHLA